MAFTVGDKVVVRNTLAIVVSDETINGQEFFGVVPLQGVQYLPASQVNQPVTTTPPAPANPAS